MGMTDPISLQGAHASLVPLSPDHCEQLTDSVQDGELWKLWYTSVPSPGEMPAEISRRLDLQARGSMLPFAVIDHSSGHAVGMTTFLNIDAANRRVEIGATWVRKSVQRTALNTECKLLLLIHAFERWDCIAVEFRTHYFNRQSRAGIERLGAKLDGVFRSHQLASNGTLRDTCVYSIIRPEWPTVKSHLSWQLARTRV
ncbi:MAG: GNAT family N-acetyltransferase [Gammaproteobacteria bacterium]|nr:GNAT family N-acetyltransferase [Gammaproteobacteria bacterium]